MYFFLAVCTVGIALVSVQGQEYNHVEPDVHEYTELGHCRHHKNKFRGSQISAVLGPRERYVVLKPDRGFEFNPKTVTIKRCVGACMGGLSPMPMKQEPKSFVVQRYRKGREAVQSNNCVHVTVMEHTDCKCMCMKNASSCNPLQVWDETKCGCNCKDGHKLEVECEDVDGMVWSDEDCSCRCAKEPEQCLNGMRWSMEKCKCALQ